MQAKRIIVFVVSAAAGVLANIGLIYGLFATTPERFAYSNIALIFVSVGCIVGIWLDYFLDTKILKS